MAVKSPGDALPCSIPQANAEKLRAIGAKSPVADVLPDGTSGKPGSSNALTVAGRTVPAPANASVGGQVNLSV